MNWWPTVERWEALRLALGARGALPREVGTLIPPPRVPIGALAPPTAPPPRAIREGLANLGRIAPRERGNTPVIPGRRDRTAQRAARSRRTRNLDVIAHDISGFGFAPEGGAPRNDGERGCLIQRPLPVGAVERKRWHL